MVPPACEDGHPRLTTTADKGMWKKGRTLNTAGAATEEERMEIPQNIKHRLILNYLASVCPKNRN